MKKVISMKNSIILYLIFISASCSISEKGNMKYLSREALIDLQSENKVLNNLRISIQDTIRNWEINKLVGYNYKSTVETRVDTLIAMNKEGNKIIFAKLRRINETHGFDGITYMYGTKIKNKWYFFGGPYMVIARKSRDTPNTFSQLSEIAYQKIFRHYLKTNAKGELEINEKFFKDLTSVAWYTGDEPKNQSEWDSVYLKIVRDNWSRRDTTDNSKEK